MPYGSDLRGDIEVNVDVCQDEKILGSTSRTLTKSIIMENAKMCIDHKNGLPLKSNSQRFCYPGPGQINHHRKRKRRCLGLHTYPINFEESIELLADSSY